MNMPANKRNPAIGLVDIGTPGAATVPMSAPAAERAVVPGSRSGVISALLVVAIAAAAWFFFETLFVPRASVPVPIAEVPAPVVALPPVFVPTESSSLPVINLPTADVQTGSGPVESVPNVVREDPPANTAPTVTAAAAPARRARARGDTPRSAAQFSAGRLPGGELSVDAKNQVSLPRAPVSEPPAAPAGTTGAEPVVSDDAVQSVVIPARPEEPSRRSMPDGTTVIARFADSWSDIGSVSVDLATISMRAPPVAHTGKPEYPAGGVVVIVNKANSKSFARADISNIYHDRVTRWPSGERILVLDLPLDSGDRRRFSVEVLDRLPLDAATESSSRAITNHVQNEYRTKTADVVVSYVERNENAIGYVPAAAIAGNHNVRVVYAIP